MPEGGPPPANPGVTGGDMRYLTAGAEEADEAGSTAGSEAAASGGGKRNKRKQQEDVGLAKRRREDTLVRRGQHLRHDRE